MTNEEIIGAYRAKLDAAYESAIKRLWTVAEQDSPRAGVLAYKLLCVLGQAAGAARKAAMSAKGISELHDLRRSGVDVTPTLALNALRRASGLGATWTTLLREFGTPGRAADDKTTADLAAVIEAVAPKMATFSEALAVVKKDCKKAWGAALADATKAARGQGGAKRTRPPEFAD